MKNHYELVDENKNKSFLVITGFIVFVSLSAYFISYALGFDSSAVFIAIIFSSVTSLISYYFSGDIVLSISNAVPANKKDHFDLFTVTENLSIAAKIPNPKLFVIEDTALNAFATGRDPEHAVICATTGLIKKLNRTELEGVIAHEISHIKNNDILLMSIVSVLVGMLTLLADLLLRSRFRRKNSSNDDNGFEALFFVVGIVLALLSPIIAQIIQLAISRRREFLADASGASLTKYPEGLASALEKISGDKEPLEAANKATAHLYISNPLKNHFDSVGMFASLFNTHPPIKERIAALRSM